MIVDPIAAAEQDVADAVQFYVSKGLQVARDLLSEYDAAVQRIVELPNAWPPVGKGLRRCLLTRFPYQIVYRVEGDIIRVYAVAHVKRRPGYWRKRVGR